MEGVKDFPTEIDSVSVDRALLKNIAYLNKKRKFLPEQLGLPLAKHKCFENSINSRCDHLPNKNFCLEDFPVIINQKPEKGESTDCTDPESARDSNSFAADSDSVVSSCDCKSERGISKTYSSSQPCSSVDNWENDGIKMDTDKEEHVYMTEDEEHDSCHPGNGLNECQNLEDRLLEFGCHADYAYSGYGDETIEDCEGEEVEDMLYSKGVNPNAYVLSSGRWNVDQGAQSGSRKPTIDQEFEQYFSSLMLQ